MGRLANLLVFAALVAAAAGCGGNKDNSSGGDTRTGAAGAASTTQGTDAAAALETQFERVVNQVSPKVVQIQTSQGLGSGVVYDDAGNIVTNAHVVGKSTKFTVTLADGSRHKGDLVGSFPPDDLAVVHMEGGSPEPATLADSSKLKVGQLSFAIGNPLGLRSSVTQGIVSSLGRTVSEGNGAVITAAIQTSAPINPGNSGGALVDIDGAVIGIPTLAAVNPEFGSAAPGIGFAIPSNQAKRIADQLVKTGKVTNSGRAYLGVRIASTLGGDGVLIAGVEKGGPAAGAGLRPGELIVAVDHKPTPTTDELATVLAGLRPGQKVPVDVVDPNGGKRTVTVTLGQLRGG